jgi:phage host-nuclease inhibitor protein Gam
MAYFNPQADALCSEDIDALRQVFDQFCETHQTTGSDTDMQICAAAVVRLYQSGVRDPAALTRACEAALRQDFAIGA